MVAGEIEIQPLPMHDTLELDDPDEGFATAHLEETTKRPCRKTRADQRARRVQQPRNEDDALQP